MDYLIKGETLTDIANAIRSKTKKTDPIPTTEMAKEIQSIKTDSIYNEIGSFTVDIEMSAGERTKTVTYKDLPYAVGRRLLVLTPIVAYMVSMPVKFRNSNTTYLTDLDMTMDYEDLGHAEIDATAVDVTSGRPSVVLTVRRSIGNNSTTLRVYCVYAFEE